MQIIPRLDTHELQGIEHECEGRCSEKFFGFCVSCDVGHHTMISGMYKGVADKFRNFAHNRRALSPFLFTLVEPYMNPYYAMIVINGFFLYMMMLAGRQLAVNFKLDQAVGIVFAILLAANKLFLEQVFAGTMYLSKYAFAILILFAGYKLLIFSKSTPLKIKMLFGSIIACCSLTYDPYIYVTFLFLWGLFCTVSVTKRNAFDAMYILLHTVVYCSIPILSQFMFEHILQFYGLEGWNDNVMIRNHILSKLISLPVYLFHHSAQCYQIITDSIYQLVFKNPMKMEHIQLWGAFSVIFIFIFIPRYVEPKKQKGIWALYLAVLLIPTLAMLAAVIPPKGKYISIYTHQTRTGDFFPVLLLAQSIAIYHFSKFCQLRMPEWINTRYLAYSIGSVIYLLSYYEMFSET
ncbi:hypothetical protein QUF75_05175 [Desulfococcaceae bacterium HSG7]|nr:hypothetical protein [Desulfococcaceae bacterium HSG7]